MKKIIFLLVFTLLYYSFVYANIKEQTFNYLRNGSFEYGLNLDWEYYISENSDAAFSLSEGSQIYDGGNVGLKVDVNSVDSPTSIYARTRVAVGADSLYLLQFWARGPENARLYVEIEGSEQRGVLYEMRAGNGDSKGEMVAFHYPLKIDKANDKKELVITFYFRSSTTYEKSNNPNDCYITSHPGVTYYLDGLVLVDQSNNMHHDVYNTYLWNYNQVPNENNQSWTAGDNDVSFDLPDGRRMWFFNDSFYGKNLTGTNVFPGGTFTRNAVVIQNVDGSLHSLPITNQGGQWTYFRIPDEDVVYNTAGNSSSGVKNVFWVGDALIEDGQVKVYLIEVYGKDRSYLGKFTYPELEFIGIEEQESFCRKYEKFFVEDNTIYLYANGGSGWTRTMYAARAELGDMNGKKGTWRFWDGNAWNPDNTTAVEVSPRGADAVMKLGENNYVQLSMPVMSPEVYVRFAPSPEGPWEHETLVGIGDRSANYWYYMPNFHGQLPNGKYSISMSANYHGCLFFCKDCENQLYVDKYWYRPRYIQVDLLALSPYTTNKKDCAGVENGDAYFDECGACVGGNTDLEHCLTGVCKLYAAADYSANATGLNAGEYTSANLIGLGFEPKSLSSFVLDPGYIIELYTDDNFQGNMKLFETGISNLENENFDDQTSSLIIRRKGVEGLDGTYAIQNQQSGLYMGIQGYSTINNALLTQQVFTGNNAQKFELKYIGNGYYTIIAGSEKPLNIVDQSVEAMTYVEQWDGKESDITVLGGEISAQYSDSPSGEGITNLADKNVKTKFLTFHNSAWVQFKAVDACVLSRYSLTSANDAPVRDPKSWTLMGSNDGEIWVTLDTQSDVSFSQRFEEQSFMIDNNIAYAYYKLNMTCALGNLLQLSEWKLYANTNLPVGTYYDSQKFIVQDAGNGLVRIINKASDMLLEVLDGFVNEGAKVWQNTDYGQSGGLWKLRDFEQLLSVSETTENHPNVVVYPNPVSEFVTLQTKGFEIIMRILIIDLTGRIIRDNIYDKNQVSIDSSDLGKGIYTFKIYTDMASYSHKVIKL